MSEQTLRCISVSTTLEAEDAICEILFQIFEASAAIWHNLETKVSTISVYAELAQEVLAERKQKLRTRLRELEGFGLNPGSLKISARKVKPEDWSESWKRHFKPIEIGDKLLIKPSWSRRKPQKGAAVVILDPGLSFGTGQHPTTSFCLEELASARAKATPQSFLDIGTGTGVLAIAAEKLGYEPVTGFDFDPVAVRVAKENGDVNRCGIAQFKEQDLLKLAVQTKEKHDVICANLIYDILLEGQKRIVNRLKNSGVLILAGILTTQFPQILQSYESIGMKLIRKKELGEWTSGSFRFDAQNIC